MKDCKWVPKTGQRSEAANEFNMNIGYQGNDGSTGERVVLVDLSDSTNFPHGSTTHLDITRLTLEADIDGTTDGVLKVGYITDTSGGTTDFNWVASLYCKGGAGPGSVSKDYVYQADQISGSASEQLYAGGYRTTAGTTFVADAGSTYTTLTSDGTCQAAVGDLVMIYDYTAGTAPYYGVRLNYHSH